MSERTAAGLRADYLQRLDIAMSELPHALAVELSRGIEEELRGDDVAIVEQRIAVLGPPEDVAEAARAEAQEAVPLLARADSRASEGEISEAAGFAIAQKPPVIETRGFAIASAIALGARGIVLPIIGWLIGIGMVSYSRMWRLGEKLWAVFGPFLAVLLGWAVFAAVNALAGGQDAGCAGDCTDASNPLLPSLYDTAWSTALLGYLVGAPLGGLWLLLRLRGRQLTNPPRRPIP